MGWRKYASPSPSSPRWQASPCWQRRGLNFGIDFKGGSAIEVQSVNGPADPAKVREDLGALGLGDVQVQGFGAPEDLLIRIETQPGGDAAQGAAVQQITAALGADQYQVRRTESVGPTVSGELATTERSV